MLDLKLKEEWLEKIKIIEHKKASVGYGVFSIMTSFYNAPEEVRLDEEITWKVLMESEEFLWNVHENFKYNKDFLLKLIDAGYKQDIYRAISHTAVEKDEEIFRHCLKRNEKIGYTAAYHKIPKKLVMNKVLMLETLKTKNIYEDLEEVYRYDKDIIDIYVANHENAFLNLRKRMQNYVLKNKSLSLKMAAIGGGFKFLSQKQKEEKEFIDITLSVNKYNIELVPEKVKEDRNFVIESIKKYQIPFHYYKAFIHDIEIANLAVDNKEFDINSLQSIHLLKNKELIFKILQKHPKTYINRISTELKNDFDIVSLAISNVGRNLSSVSKQWQDNKDMVLLAGQTEPLLRNLNISERLKNDIDIVDFFVRKDVKNYEDISPERKKDIEIGILMMEMNLNNYNKLVLELRNNWECIHLFTLDNKNEYYKMPSHRFSEMVASTTDKSEYPAYVKKQAELAKLNRTLKNDLIITPIINKKAKI